MSENCIFCKIVSGQVKSQNVHEDDDCVAFKDLNPQAPTHLLVVPKKHIPSLAAAVSGDEALLGRLQGAIRAIAKSQKLDSYRVVTNIGRMAGQSVDHLHYHVLGGRRLGWPPG
ncbi:MAG TPA: histidine triad nucleotide-binding protein [Elusimicrobia bacterium]|nr:MAG: histidine triad nucleotide-binding protein [Elusimicrobia bacterium RIFOXYB2_FULL_62_6]HAH07014.1 histidine triad nucleotide-binding protein [Elusimicrobiota bacterium]